jgi:hypothetical protein
LAQKPGFIRAKGKAASRDGQGTWKISSSLLLTYRDFFYLVFFVGEEESGVRGGVVS